MTRKQKKLLIRLIISLVAFIALQFIKVEGIIKLALYLFPYLIVGYDVLLKAFRGITRGRVFDECFLMSIATVGAFLLGYLQTGDYAEGVAVMLFYQTGELFQSYALHKSRKSIAKLMDVRPDHATIEVDGELIRVSPESVAIGSVITVSAGEKIAIDGEIIEGSSTLNTAALTGESLPCEVGVGDKVLSGSVNLSGVIKIRTEKEFGQSTASKILDLVQNASSRKSKSENFITKFSLVYTPAVCVLALILAVFPPLIGYFASSALNFEIWLYRALSFLVASCPCALVVSIPLAFFATLGRLSRQGVLVKGSNYLERLASADTIAFDKTGTLTKGVFEVVDIQMTDATQKHTKDEVLYYAAHAESHSTHPIASGITSAYGKRVDLSLVTDITEKAGDGVYATVGGVAVHVGKTQKNQSSATDKDVLGTSVAVHVNGEHVATITLSDVVKQTSKNALRSLKKLGVRKTVMLSGDNEITAKTVADEVGLDDFKANLLPQDKVTAVEDMLDKKSNRSTLCYVGDGLNDAPVLARADVGIAMGALGSDGAIEVADVVLMDDDPQKIATAIRSSKKCMAIVWENTVFSIGVKALALILVALGVANMWLAVFADVGVMLIAVLNSLRTLMAK